MDKQEISKIQNQFNEVLRYSQEEPDPNTDQLFEMWASAKQRFIDGMGGQLIYEYPEEIAFELDEASKLERLQELIMFARCGNDEFAGSEEIADFLSAEIDGLIKNKVVLSWSAPNKDIIPVGMKIGKALTQYYYGYDYPTNMLINELQVRMSRIIQENKIRGKLCLSVHPLDYLSVSENNHNWRSCHALNGEYRSGNLNYMVDETTVVVYLKSEEDTVPPRFPDTVPWNDKKWRCLFFFDFNRNMIWAGRQYPFFSVRALDTISQVLFARFYYFCNALNKSLWQKQTIKSVTINGSEYSLVVPSFVDDGEIISLDEIIKDGKNTFHFNDLLHSSYYVPYSYKIKGNPNIKFIKEQPKLIIGKAAPCIHCGHELIGFSDAMYCKQCLIDSNSDTDELTYCACCGEHIIKDDDFAYNGNYYCQDCFYDMHIIECAECGELLPQDEANTENGNEYYCDYCWSHLDKDVD